VSGAGPVVVLAGGTGGAKLARGMQEVVGERLVVIANTGDDVDIHGARVCPDPDLVIFHLADRIDERGWGLAGDTFNAMEQLAEIGSDPWFRLGDRDLAIGLDRARRLGDGERLTDILALISKSLGVPATVLPMSDAPVATFVTTPKGRRPFQEFMIVDRCEGPIEAIDFDGIEAAAPRREALEALATAEAIVIGPSNPAISIDPILAVPGIREAITASPARVACVSPLVGGASVKGPTMDFLGALGIEPSAEGIAGHYADVADVLVADEPAASMATRVCDVLMGDLPGQVRLAREALEAAIGSSR